MSLQGTSRTAEYMALFRALESAAPTEQRLFTDPEAARFLSPPLRLAARAARIAPLQRAIVGYIDRRYPGPRLSGVVRTRVIDDFVLAATADGREQLVLLGAGYDTRGSRLALDPGVSVFEIDHPATQVRKRALRAVTAHRVRYVPVDFESDDLTAALHQAGLDSAEPCCIVWEGVFSYLTPPAIDATLTALRAACGPRSLLLLTYLDRLALAEPSAWTAAVRDAGEPFRTTLDPSEAAAFFGARDLALRGDESTRDAALRLGVAGAERIPGFYRLATLAL